MTTPDPRTEVRAAAHPAVRVVAEVLSARLDLERWERDGWPTVDDDLAAAVAPAFLRWIAGQFEARGRRQAVGGAHPAHLTTVASCCYAAAAEAGMWADEIEDAIDADAAQRALADPAPSASLDAVMADYIPDPADVELVAHELRTTVEGGETVTDAAGRILDAVRPHLEAPLRAELADSRRLADMRLRVIALHREEIAAAGRVIDAARDWCDKRRDRDCGGQDFRRACIALTDAVDAFDAPAGRTGPLYCGAVGEHIDNPAPTKEDTDETYVNPHIVVWLDR